MNRSTLGRAAAIDLLLVVLVHTASRYLCGQFAGEYGGWICTVLTLAFAWWRLRVRSESFRDIGFYRPQSLGRVVVASGLTVVGAMVLATAVAMLLRQLGFERETPDLRRFTEIQGNLQLYSIWMAINLVAATSEEAIYRGFVISRLERVFPRTPAALILVLLMQAVYFGLRHYYQGFIQAFVAGAIGLVLGISYVLMKRNLWVPVIAHISLNAMNLTSRFLG